MRPRKAPRPRHKIVSMRLRDDEWKRLSTRCRKAKKNVSDFLRDLVLSLEQGTLDRKEISL